MRRSTIATRPLSRPSNSCCSWRLLQVTDQTGAWVGTLWGLCQQQQQVTHMQHGKKEELWQHLLKKGRGGMATHDTRTTELQPYALTAASPSCCLQFTHRATPNNNSRSNDVVGAGLGNQQPSPVTPNRHKSTPTAAAAERQQGLARQAAHCSCTCWQQQV